MFCQLRQRQILRIVFVQIVRDPVNAFRARLRNVGLFLLLRAVEIQRRQELRQAGLDDAGRMRRTVFIFLQHAGKAQLDQFPALQRDRHLAGIKADGRQFLPEKGIDGPCHVFRQRDDVFRVRA